MVEKLDCGIIWIKIDQSILEFDEDAFISYIYIREPNKNIKMSPFKSSENIQ